MTAIDTNLLVYAFRPNGPFHERATIAIEQLANSGASVGIPYPCIHEFLAVSTNPRIFPDAADMSEAVSYIERFRDEGGIRYLAEGDGYMAILSALLAKSPLVRGPRVHDARIAAICENHGVRELWTADRDFSRFPSIRVRNPLI